MTCELQVILASYLSMLDPSETPQDILVRHVDSGRRVPETLLSQLPMTVGDVRQCEQPNLGREKR
jgi:hypothetical protein